MAMSEEHHRDLEDAASVALHLCDKIENANNEGVRQNHSIPIMVAMVSNKPVQHPGPERKTSPMRYNHIMLLCGSEKVREVSKLVPLTDPSSSRPLLRHSIPRHDEHYEDPDGVWRPVVLSHDAYEIAESLADDVISGYHDDVERLKSNVDHLDAAKPDEADEKYDILRRGRAHYRENASPYTSDSPVAEHSHRRSQHGRSKSLPPHYDTTLMSHDHDPFHGAIHDKEEHKATLVEKFRKISEYLLIFQHPMDRPLKRPGSGEGTFSRKDIFVECYMFAYQRQNRVDGNGNKVDLLVKENVKMLRDFLKYSKRLDVTTALIKDVIFPEQTVVSAGALYFSDAALQAEQERSEAEATRPTLFNQDAPIPGWKAKRTVEKANSKGTAKSKNRYQPIAAHTKQAGKQDEATSVFLKVHNDPNVKQYGRLHIKQNYIDSSKPYQPVYEVQININDRNARRELYKPVRNKQGPPFYQDALALYDVSHPALGSCLEHLYQHVLKDNKDYFDHLRLTLRDDQKLWLLSIPYNDAQWSSNLFSTVTNRPAIRPT
ncbi:hypothetical protein N0V95_005981 [Ascochyta clinopodiicola]|nr:hypothetical protein N0V95_005981 [Ascochyta clinopodiicola]